jgi:hypothetical protein
MIAGVKNDGRMRVARVSFGCTKTHPRGAEEGSVDHEMKCVSATWLSGDPLCSSLRDHLGGGEAVRDE